MEFTRDFRLEGILYVPEHSAPQQPAYHLVARAREPSSGSNINESTLDLYAQKKHLSFLKLVPDLDLIATRLRMYLDVKKRTFQREQDHREFGTRYSIKPNVNQLSNHDILLLLLEEKNVLEIGSHNDVQVNEKTDEPSMLTLQDTIRQATLSSFGEKHLEHVKHLPFYQLRLFLSVDEYTAMEKIPPQSYFRLSLERINE